MTVVSIVMPDGPQFDTATETALLKVAGMPLVSRDRIAAILNWSLPPRSITTNPRRSVRL